MPLAMTEPGTEVYIKRIGGRGEVRQHLEQLGFTVGTMVKVVSVIAGNVIVLVKGSRIAISREMAMKITV